MSDEENGRFDCVCQLCGEHMRTKRETTTMATTFTFRTTLDEDDDPIAYEILKEGEKLFEATYDMYSPEDNNLRRNFKDVLRLPEIFKLIVEAGPDVNFVEETVLKEEVW